MIDYCPKEPTNPEYFIEVILYSNTLRKAVFWWMLVILIQKEILSIQFLHELLRSIVGVGILAIVDCSYKFRC